MQKAKLTIAAAALITALPLLQGCVPAVIATGATVGVMSYQDRRPTAIQTEDESIEWKASRSVPEKYCRCLPSQFHLVQPAPDDHR